MFLMVILNLKACRYYCAIILQPWMTFLSKQRLKINRDLPLSQRENTSELFVGETFQNVYLRNFDRFSAKLFIKIC